MFAFLGSVLGLFGSFFPEILKFFKAKEDHKHELAIMDRQIERDKLQHEYQMEEINTKADIEESRAIYKASEQKMTGVKWIDAIISFYTSSVRPTITYSFFALYGLVKYAQYASLRATSSASSISAIKGIWTEEDMAIFCTIISYWFGQRGLQRYLGKK